MEIKEVAAEKKYNLRPLGAKDVFSMSRIIAKVGLKNFKHCFKGEEIQKIINKFKEEAKAEKAAKAGKAENVEKDKKAENVEINVETLGAVVALDVADVLFENLPNCEKEMFSFLASLLDMKVADVEIIPPADFLELIIEVVKKPEFTDFFKVALRLLK